LDDLLAKANGRKVAGGEMELVTANATLETIAIDWRTKALAAISDPNVAFLLLLIGFYGIILEFWTPGTYLPGVVGAISLIVALTALTALPGDYRALGLLAPGTRLVI